MSQETEEMDVDPPADTRDQGSGQTQDDMEHQNYQMAQTPSSDSQIQLAQHAQLTQNNLFSNVQGVSDTVDTPVTKQPSSLNEVLPKMRHNHPQTPSSSSSGGLFPNDKDIYTAGTGDQGSGQTQDDMRHQTFLTDRTHSSDLMRNNLFSNVQQTPSSSSSGGLFPNDKDIYTAGTGDQGSGQTQDDMKHQTFLTDRTHSSDLMRNNLFSNVQISAGDQGSRPSKTFPTDRTHGSDSQRNEQTPPSSSSDGQFPNGQGSHTAGADSSSTLDDMKTQKNTMDPTHKSNSPPGEDNYGGDESQPSAPLDIATFVIKVDLKVFPDKWKTTLEKALQSWLLKMEGQTSVHDLKLLEDQSCAEVQITPSTALEAIKKLKSISLTFKHEKKDVTAWILPDEMRSVTGPQNPSILDKNRISSPQVNRAVALEDKNDVEDVSATNSGLPVPLYQFWYMHHAYRKELDKIEKQHGVSICAEVSVSIKHTESSRPDSVSKATEDFNKLVQGCVGSFSDAAVNHNHMDSDIVKQTLHAIQSEETKMMFTMSARNCLFFGPKKFTDMIKREVEETRMESQFNDKSSQMSKHNHFSPQSRSSLDMDTKDLPTQLEMDTVYWDLMKLSYKDQLSQLETKYGVSFHEEKRQKNLTIKVQARSKGDQLINLESHAIRALTQLYQKLASAAVTCELKNPTDATRVASTVEKLQQQHHCVVAADVLSPWRLVGLPQHLGPAIADIEKTLQKSVFDDKKKKLIGYSGDIPHARGIKWNQTPDYGSGAVGGSVRDEGVNLRRRSEADTGFNEESKDSSRHESKDTEEETCAICMDSFTDKKKLKCGHEFCRDCINASEKSLGSICPVCKEVYGILEGTQPHGTMKVTQSRLSLPGYPYCGTIEINYSIPDGVQTEKHPNPGQRYYGTHRQAYLPDNPEGNEVLKLLRRAFDQKLIFTVGRSTTTGAENAVTWNDIHHKTNTSGGPERYGYPDLNYLKRVKDELKAKGIE